MDARGEAGVSITPKDAQDRLTAYFDLVGDHRALFVTHGFNVGDGKAAVAQIGESALQGLMKFVLQGGSLLWWGEDASVDAVLLAMAIVGEQHKLDLVRRGGDANLGLVAKPAARSEQHKDENENDGDVVLPSATFIGPKKCPRENLLQAGHVNPLGHRQRSRRRACARHGRSK